MSEHKTHAHISSYNSLAMVLVILLVLTAITVTITWIDLKAWTVAAAMIIACIKGGIVLSYFMHLKFDSKLYKFMVGGVILLYAVVLIITFFDYLFR